MSGIYVHIPYCKSHCTYCGFYSELLRSAQGSEPFVDALVSEINGGIVGCWDLRAPRSAHTLYFGGGTPSLLSLEQLRRIVEALPKAEWEEFTMEVNPDDIVKGGAEYALGLRRLGVNRISMGVQSFDDKVLHTMGRRHNAQQALDAYTLLRKAGFDNISIDFIFGYTPQWSVQQMREGLERLPDMPEHISCYQLSIEPGSGLEKLVERGKYQMPSDEQCESQYYAICDLLRDLGYEHYEISNWCKPGRKSRHNSSYWDHTPYVGFGPGAHSLLVSQEGTMVRRWNNPDTAAYIAAAKSGDWNAVRGSETLTAEQVREERIMLGLRRAEGVDGRTIPENQWFISDSIILDILKD